MAIDAVAELETPIKTDDPVQNTETIIPKLAIKNLRHYKDVIEERRHLRAFEKGRKGDKKEGDILQELLGATTIEDIRALSTHDRLLFFKSALSPKVIDQDLPPAYLLKGYKVSRNRMQKIQKEKEKAADGNYTYILYLQTDVKRDLCIIWLSTAKEDTDTGERMPHYKLDQQVTKDMGHTYEVLREGVLHVGKNIVEETSRGGSTEPSRQIIGDGNNELSMRAVLDTHFDGYKVKLMK